MSTSLFSLILFCSFLNIPGPSSNVWYKRLPECPCRNPDYNGTILNDGWAIDKGNLSKYHQGAFISYRSYPAIKTSEGMSGQQCCYDKKGNLIVAGRAAGTPDKISTCSGEDKDGRMKLRLAGLIGHIYKDVYPWKKYMKHDTSGWKEYNKLWRPSQGKNCLEITDSSQ